MRGAFLSAITLVCACRNYGQANEGNLYRRVARRVSRAGDDVSSSRTFLRPADIVFVKRNKDRFRETRKPAPETRALPGALAAQLRRRFGLAQMRDAVFLTVARHPKLQIWVAHFGRSTNCAPMQGFHFCFARLHFKPAAARSHITTMTGVADDARSEKDQIVPHRANGGGAKLH